MAQDLEGPKIIHAALFRMGTKSLARAYQILGFNTYHALFENVMNSPWAMYEKAAEAKWPTVPGAPAQRRPPLERADWDAIWGSYDALADLAAPFALDLAAAYPDSKVVIVQRDFDSWWPSFKSQLLDPVMRQPQATIFGAIGHYVFGVRPVQAMRKAHFGFFGATTPAEIEANAREAYEAYYRDLRSLIPPERRLEYTLGSGWEPLCSFLGVDVPEGVEFPMSNIREDHAAEVASRRGQFIMGAVKFVAPVVVGVVAIIAGRRYLTA